MNVLAFVTDAFGGHGGIAKYNRDVLRALCERPEIDEILTLPRVASRTPGPLPAKLRWASAALSGRRAYLREGLRHVVTRRHFDLVLCGHLSLLPLAFLAARRHGATLVQFIFGIDAWQPTRHRLVNHLARRVDRVVSISTTTLERFRAWSAIDATRCAVLPNAVDSRDFAPGPRPARLLDRYGLSGKRIILTMGRMAASERYKGFDEVLGVLPDLARTVPDIAYVLAGDGDDRPRLEAHARRLGVAHRTIFTGRVDEAEKADHYRLADAFVMPSRGEGFGFVFLEAMACGTPVVASRVDGSREAVRDGALGILVDPGDAGDLRAGILQALTRPRGQVPEGLDHFSLDRFRSRLAALLHSMEPRP